MMGRGGKGMGKRTRSNKCLNGDQALTDYSEPTVMTDVSQPHTKHSYPRNGEGLNIDNNIEEVLHIHETSSNVTGFFDADKSMQSLKKSMGSKLSNENTIAGDYDKIKKGMTSVKWKATMTAIEAEWKKLLADVTSTTNVPINEGIGLKEDTPIIKLVSFTKPISYVGASGASSSKPSTGKANFRHLVSDNVFDGFQLSILMNVVRTISSRLENALYGYFIGKRITFLVMEYFVRNNWTKYGLTRLMMNSKGFFFFKFDSTKGQEDVLKSGPWMIRNSPIILKKWTMNTRPYKEELTLISVGRRFMVCRFKYFQRMALVSLRLKLKADEALKDNITIGIPIPKGVGFTKETVRVEYEWKPPRCEQCFNIVKTTWRPIKQKVRFDSKSHGNSQKANNGNIVHSISKEKPSKAANVPSSSYTCGSTKNGGLQYHSSASNIHTSNPYDALDDMESDEEVEVIYDETTNLFGNNITRATYTTPDASKT
ncbi:zinc knuckle CX2CX4HX4C containing protein [Tanacetum coccineum]